MDIKLEFRPLEVSLERTLIMVHRGPLWLAIKPEEVDDLVGKLQAIKAVM